MSLHLSVELDSLMRYGIAIHINESWLVEGGELVEAMKQLDAEQWKEAINA